MPTWAGGTAIAAATAVMLMGCGRRPPPIGKFEVKYELPKLAAQAPPEPPPSVLRPWRVWVNQERPRQRKNPEWRSFGARDGALLDIAADGKWRCLVNPVSVLGTVGERAKLAGWVASRSVRCSSDGWKTNIEAFVRAAFDPGGNPTEIDSSAALYLNDVVSGQERTTVVVLEGQRVTRTE
jgi:hypothetical protein